MIIDNDLNNSSLYNISPELIVFDSFLQIPKYPSKTLEMPSKSTKLVFSQRDAQLARELHRSRFTLFVSSCTISI